MDTIDFGNSVSIQAKYGVLVRQAGSSLATDDLLIAVIDLDTSGGMVKSTTSDFKIDPAADGMFTDQ
ncbi:hypothetical protein SALB1_3494 [Salinisphaera sp. LB1]|nr:hypothetical protein SALB1_3494 [Salinisphaera sp. LB1]